MAVSGARQDRVRHLAGAVALACLAASASCGTTRIVASEKDAKIYLDGRLVARDSITIRRRGGPAATEVVVKTGDGREVKQLLKRSFDIRYLAAFFIAWSYPEEVVVKVPEVPHKAGFDDRDAWVEAPEDWSPTPERDRPVTSTPAWGSTQNAQSRPSAAQAPPTSPGPGQNAGHAADKTAVKKDGSGSTAVKKDGSGWDRPPPAKANPSAPPASTGDSKDSSAWDRAPAGKKEPPSTPPAKTADKDKADGKGSDKDKGAAWDRPPPGKKSQPAAPAAPSAPSNKDGGSVWEKPPPPRTK